VFTCCLKRKVPQGYSPADRPIHAQSTRANGSPDERGLAHALRDDDLSLASYGRDVLISMSAARNTKNTTAITPFMVKKAALSLLRSLDETSECS